MRCPSCQEENPPAAKFCLACGVRLRHVCARCGTDLPAHARFCFECGLPITPDGAAPAPSAPVAPTVAPGEAPAGPAAGQIVLERADVVHALYEQGRDALRRGDRAAAAAALTAVVEEAPNAYPDAYRYRAEALRGRPGGAAAPLEWSRATSHAAEVGGSRVGRLVGRGLGPWSSWAQAVGQSALQRVPGLRAVPAAAAGWLGPARPALAAAANRQAFPTWALIFAIILLMAMLVVRRGGTVAPRAVDAEALTPVPTLESDADLLARCQGAVDAKSWDDAIKACRIMHARDPDHAGLADALAAAYVGRGEQRLAAADTLGQAATDFQQALTYQPDSSAAQTDAQRLAAYQAGEKAMVVGDWPTAVSQFSAVYAQAPDYLDSLGARSLKGRLFAAWLAWGQSALNADAAPDAAERCRQALALVPDDADAQHCVATAESAIAAAAAGTAGE